MVEFVQGLVRTVGYRQDLARDVASALRGLPLTGVFYLGYPVLSTAGERVEIDGLLVSREHGVVALLLRPTPPAANDAARWAALSDEQDRVAFAVDANLKRYDSLRVRRDLAVPVEVVTVFATPPNVPAGQAGRYVAPDTLVEALNDLRGVEDQFWRHLNAAIQHTSMMRPPKRRANATRAGSRGQLLQRIESEIANLDEWQKKAAIESPEGPQRIRGLAGSGKTIVLAMKAAYLHAQRPDWKIAVTFYSRALHAQFASLIERFMLENGDEPNWENLQVLHAWGGTGRPGLYSRMADAVGAPARDFRYARAKFGNLTEPFAGVCRELLEIVTSSDDAPQLFDAVLVDEAQDLPPSFLQLVYHFTKSPKRIVWAYDELQRLSEATMPSTDELFGVAPGGASLIDLRRGENDPETDIILPTCYRNTPWALTVAHALGIGAYRPEGLIQYVDESQLWLDIGYEVESGSLQDGQEVALRRRADATPRFFQELLSPEDGVQHKRFESETDQAEWLAESIETNLGLDELDPDDILIILPDAYTSRRSGDTIRNALERRGINSHLVGVTSSPDIVFSRDSVALANIYRSKGNEAPMVYVVNAHLCVQGYELQRLRNTLFTAVTRSRAWVRISGIGERMQKLEEEVQAVVDNNYRLKFKVPTPPERERMKVIHRDRTDDERQQLEQNIEGARRLIQMLESGELDPDALPGELRSLGQVLRGTPDGTDR